MTGDRQETSARGGTRRRGAMEGGDAHTRVRDDGGETCDLYFLLQRERGREKGGNESRATSGKDEYFIILLKTRSGAGEVRRGA